MTDQSNQSDQSGEASMEMSGADLAIALLFRHAPDRKAKDTVLKLAGDLRTQGSTTEQVEAALVAATLNGLSHGIWPWSAPTELKLFFPRLGWDAMAWKAHLMLLDFTTDASQVEVAVKARAAMREDGVTNCDQVTHTMSAIMDGLRHGNWPWSTYESAGPDGTYVV